MSDTFYFRKGEGSLFAQILNRIGEKQGHSFCGGRGACGKCRVHFLQGAPLPSFADRKFFTPDELRAGYRLACTAKPETDCALELCFAAEREPSIVTQAFLKDEMQEALRKEKMKGSGKNLEKPTGHVFCAVDIGTTTVVMQLAQKRTGKILYTHTFQNPQRAYGADVLSRLAAAENGLAERLRGILLTELENGVSRMQEKLQNSGYLENTWEILCSGNTAIEHLLLGYPVEGLGKAPFLPYHRGFSYFDLSGHQAVFLPGISAFVGGDIVSGMYACRMAEREGMTLLIDLGTNGEMAVGNRDGILCTATAAGPAFEGGALTGIFGADMTAIAYDMRKCGIMDETGLLAEPYFTEGYPYGEALIRQADIRALQMAKAAVFAGVTILMDQADAWERIEQVYLAGGFGYYLDVNKAVEIGLLPASLEKCCIAAGNTSLAGALRYGMEQPDFGRRIEAEREDTLSHIVNISRAINLAQQPEFEHRYMESMDFCRMEKSREEADE